MKVIRRTILAAAVLLALVALDPSAPAAEAQLECPGGTLVGEECHFVGDPPKRDRVCAPGDLGVPGACYIIVDNLPSGDCPPGSVMDSAGLCRKPRADSTGPWYCTSGHELINQKCIRIVAPTCGPLGCYGKISLTYRVECVGEARAKVILGSPTTTNGASVSLITLNGSVEIGRELPGGSAIEVKITPNRSRDQVSVQGPATAPPCTTVAPSATPVPTSPPSTSSQAAQPPTPTSNPLPTPTPAAPTSEPTPTPEPTPEPTATPTAAPVPTPDEVEAPGDTEPVTTTDTEADDAGDGDDGDEVLAGSTTPPSSSDDGFPIVPVAAIAGVTIIVSSGLYAGLSRPRRYPY